MEMRCFNNPSVSPICWVIRGIGKTDTNSYSVGALKSTSEMEQYGPNDEYFCPDCIDEMVICEDCGDVHHYEEMFYVHNTDGDDDRYYVCEGCLDAHYERCDECGEYFRSREMETHGGCTYCPTCYEENFMECPECGDMIEIGRASCRERV